MSQLLPQLKMAFSQILNKLVYTWWKKYVLSYSSNCFKIRDAGLLQLEIIENVCLDSTKKHIFAQGLYDNTAPQIWQWRTIALNLHQNTQNMTVYIVIETHVYSNYLCDQTRTFYDCYNLYLNCFNAFFRNLSNSSLLELLPKEVNTKILRLKLKTLTYWTIFHTKPFLKTILGMTRMRARAVMDKILTWSGVFKASREIVLAE